MHLSRPAALSGLLLVASSLAGCPSLDEREVQLTGSLEAADAQVPLLPSTDGGGLSNPQGTPSCREGNCVAVGPIEPAPPGDLTGNATGSRDGGVSPLVDGGVCPGCSIDGTCVPANTPDPLDVCRICNPAVDATAWSANDGNVCDDGLFCTVDDTCQAQICSGAPRVCDDAVSCNGVSTCDETLDACSPATNECGANGFCDVTTAACVSTCLGCLVDGVCVQAGAERVGAPCFTCQPQVSTEAYSPAPGRACGAGPAACSGQDTCDALGSCQPNHSPPNTACGSPNANACDQADACDGSGNCNTRVSANGAQCNDGAFCSVGDRCLGGQCVATGGRDCGLNQACNEQADQCQCQGCQIGNTCFFDGDENPNNPCQVCDVARSRTAFSADVGRLCGAGATDCSAQDTCDARGVCNANDNADGASCSGVAGFCQGGQCASRQQFGTDCTLATQCLSGFCRTWFVDIDGDSHGNPAQQVRLCSGDPAQDTIRPDGSGLLIPALTANGQVFVGLGDDCCDAVGGAQVFPGKVSPVFGEQTACPDRPSRDFDCDGLVTCFNDNTEPCL